MMHNLFNTFQNLDEGSGSIGSFYSLPQLERVGVGRSSCVSTRPLKLTTSRTVVFCRSC